MRKSIAYITLAILLGVPAFSVLTALLPLDRQELNQAILLTLGGDCEDQQDDADPLRDNESDQDVDWIMEKYSVLLLPARIRQSETRQEHLFQEHHREIVTPPPKG